MSALRRSSALRQNKKKSIKSRSRYQISERRNTLSLAADCWNASWGNEVIIMTYIQNLKTDPEESCFWLSSSLFNLVGSHTLSDMKDGRCRVWTARLFCSQVLSVCGVEHTAFGSGSYTTMKSNCLLPVLSLIFFPLCSSSHSELSDQRSSDHCTHF